MQQLSFNKSINNDTFCEWRNKINWGIDDNIKNLKPKIIPRTINFAIKDCAVITNVKELNYKNFVFVPVYKAADSKRLYICKRCKRYVKDYMH